MTNLLKRPLLAILACVTTACALPGEPSKADDPPFLLPRMERAVLIVSRASSVPDDGCSYRLAIDSNEAGSLAPKGWITLYPPAGVHLVSLRAEGDGCALAVQIRTRLEANHQHRLQIVRGANGSLTWDGDGPQP